MNHVPLTMTWTLLSVPIHAPTTVVVICLSIKMLVLLEDAFFMDSMTIKERHLKTSVKMHLEQLVAKKVWYSSILHKYPHYLEYTPWIINVLGCYFIVYDPCGKNQPAVMQNEFSGYIQTPNMATASTQDFNCTWFIKVGKTKSMIIKLHELQEADRYHQLYAINYNSVFKSYIRVPYTNRYIIIYIAAFEFRIILLLRILIPLI